MKKLTLFMILFLIIILGGSQNVFAVYFKPAETGEVFKKVNTSYVSKNFLDACVKNLNTAEELKDLNINKIKRSIENMAVDIISFCVEEKITVTGVEKILSSFTPEYKNILIGMAEGNNAMWAAEKAINFIRKTFKDLYLDDSILDRKISDVFKDHFSEITPQINAIKTKI